MTRCKHCGEEIVVDRVFVSGEWIQHWIHKWNRHISCASLKSMAEPEDDEE